MIMRICVDYISELFDDLVKEDSLIFVFQTYFFKIVGKSKGVDRNDKFNSIFELFF